MIDWYRILLGSAAGSLCMLAILAASEGDWDYAAFAAFGGVMLVVAVVVRSREWARRARRR